MNRGFKHRAVANLRALMALVTGSTILVPPQPRAVQFSDWERLRKSPDVDTLILAWIASHVPASAERGRLN